MSLLSLALSTLLASTAFAAAPSPDAAPVEAAVRALAHAADSRDLPGLESALHPDFRACQPRK